MRKVPCVHQPDHPKIKPPKSSLLVIVVILRYAKIVFQVYVLALVKIDMRVHLYRQLRLDFDFHEKNLVHENRCGDLRADVHTEDEKSFGVDVEGAGEGVNV